MSWSAMKSTVMADAEARIAKGKSMGEQGEAMTTNPQTAEEYEEGQRMQAEAQGVSIEGQAKADSVEQWQDDGNLPSVEGGGIFDQITKGATERLDEMTSMTIDTHEVKNEAEAQFLAPESEQKQGANDNQAIKGEGVDIADQKEVEQEQAPESPPQEQKPSSPEQSL